MSKEVSLYLFDRGLSQMKWSPFCRMKYWSCCWTKQWFLRWTTILLVDKDPSD